MQLPVTFNFRLTLTGPSGTPFAGIFPQVDVGFYSISGLAGVLDHGITDIKDAPKSAPPAVTWDTLVLRRAVVHIDDSQLSQWVFSWLYKQSAIILEQATIDLLDDKQQPYMSWLLKGVTPRSWKLDELNAGKNEVLFETIELAYTSLTFVPRNPPKPPKPGGKGDPGGIIHA